MRPSGLAECELPADVADGFVSGAELIIIWSVLVFDFWRFLGDLPLLLLGAIGFDCGGYLAGSHGSARSIDKATGCL